MFGLLFEMVAAITELLKLKYEVEEKYFHQLAKEQYEQLNFSCSHINATVA